MVHTLKSGQMFYTSLGSKITVDEKYEIDHEQRNCTEKISVFTRKKYIFTENRDQKIVSKEFCKKYGQHSKWIETKPCSISTTCT